MNEDYHRPRFILGARVRLPHTSSRECRGVVVAAGPGFVIVICDDGSRARFGNGSLELLVPASLPAEM